MNLTIEPLTPALAADFFDFFDNRAFTDDSSEGPCYCTRFQMTARQENAAFKGCEGAERFMCALRKVAEGQITSGVLRGYLAFADGLAIGWCNANDKANLPRKSGNGARVHAPAKKREKAVLCFEIAPEFRGKGVAAALLSRVCEDAKAEGYLAVEGFPRLRDERYEWDFTGPVRLYEKLGFVEAGQRGETVVMRKALGVD
ncbi:MAG: GNAT family N-acetyltransferase [Oscillospiraceae bacterium]|jgi:GNAT superfamily N-acetyltransferase|nr:GNAT family N-acetyltransferase [Oscillospiraceae bacterium]